MEYIGSLFEMSLARVSSIGLIAMIAVLIALSLATSQPSYAAFVIPDCTEYDMVVCVVDAATCEAVDPTACRDGTDAPDFCMLSELTCPVTWEHCEPNEVPIYCGWQTMH